MTWITLQRYGCAVTVTSKGSLLMKPMNADNSLAHEDVTEVTAPESQQFLNQVNQSFGTSFLMSEFAGR